jgi:hypothetical protein
LGFVLSADPADGAELGPTGDGFFAGAAEVFKLVAGWVEVEDVGAADFGVVGPDLRDVLGLAGVVVVLKGKAVGLVEGDYLSLMEHAEEFKAGWADEARANAGLVLAVSLSHQKYWG